MRLRSTALPRSTLAGLDLVVTPSGVVAYVGFTADWASNGPRFAQPGACAEGESDVGISGPTCFEHVAIGGVLLTQNDPYGPSDPVLWKRGDDAI